MLTDLRHNKSNTFAPLTQPRHGKLCWGCEFGADAEGGSCWGGKDGSRSEGYHNFQVQPLVEKPSSLGLGWVGVVCARKLCVLWVQGLLVLLGWV